jgi:hypothetical protein
VVFSGYSIKKSNKSNFKYHLLIFVTISTISGLRNPNMGLNDFAHGYLYGWRIVNQDSWFTIFSYIGQGGSSLKDPGFAMICKLLSYISSDELFFQFIISMPYYFSLCWFISKYSKVPALSYFICFALQYFTISFYLLRTIWALLFAILCFDSLYNNNTKRTFIYILLASSMHASSVILIIVFLINKTRSFRTYIILILFSLAFSVFGAQLAIDILKVILGNMRFSFYLYYIRTEGYVRFFISIAMLIFELTKYNTLIDENPRNEFLYGLGAISAVFYSLTPIIADFHRIALLFGLSHLVLLPNCIDKIKSVWIKWLFTIMIITIFGIYVFKFLLPGTNSLPYYFYWS